MAKKFSAVKKKIRESKAFQVVKGAVQKVPITRQTKITAGVGIGTLILGLIIGWKIWENKDALTEAKQKTKQAVAKAKEYREFALQAKNLFNKVKTELAAIIENHKHEIAKKDRDHENKVHKLDGRIESLDGDKKNIQARYDDLDQKYRRLASKIEHAHSPATTVLVQELGRLRKAQTKLMASRAAALARLENALVGRPDTEGIQKSVAAYQSAVKPFVTASRKVASVLRDRSQELKGSGVTIPDHREFTDDDSRKKAQRLAGLFKKAAAGIRSDEVSVRASRKEWTESDVVLEAGQQVYVSSTGKWEVRPDWAKSDASGWPGEGQTQFRMVQSAPFGCLLVRVQGSDEIHPAYGTRPITVAHGGRLEFQINDKKKIDNTGRLTVEVIRASKSAIEAALSQAKKK